ncbi:unnamed protein product [Closterium sp. NIES-53]
MFSHGMEMLSEAPLRSTSRREGNWAFRRPPQRSLCDPSAITQRSPCDRSAMAEVPTDVLLRALREEVAAIAALKQAIGDKLHVLQVDEASMMEILAQADAPPAVRAAAAAAEAHMHRGAGGGGRGHGGGGEDWVGGRGDGEGGEGEGEEGEEGAEEMSLDDLVAGLAEELEREMGGGGGW